MMVRALTIKFHGGHHKCQQSKCAGTNHRQTWDVQSEFVPLFNRETHNGQFRGRFADRVQNRSHPLRRITPRACQQIHALLIILDQAAVHEKAAGPRQCPNT